MPSDPPGVNAPTAQQQAASQRLESLGRLAGGVAHDFNNVLGVILGYVELARISLGPESDDAREHLALALSTLDRARALTERVLTVSRGSISNDDAADPNVIVGDMCGLVAESVDRRITLRVTLGNETPWVAMPRDHLAQVVLALCVNAADAMPEGGVLSVTTGRERVEDEGPLAPGVYARVDVADTGPPVSPEDAARLFDTSVAAGSAHAGGGLWVVRDLLRRADGDVQVRSDDGGSVFTVWVREHMPRVVAPPPEDVPPIEGGRILVVDDEPGLREVTRMHLEAAGYTVVEAGTADRAIEAVRSEPGAFDAVLLDLNLPDRSGGDVAAALSGIGNGPALVIVSGDPARAKALGIPDSTPMLAKPFLRQTLLHTVAKAITTRG